MISDADVAKLDPLMCIESLDDMMRFLIEHGYPARRFESQMRKRYLVMAMRVHNGNVCKAAAAVGIHRNTFQHRLSSEDRDKERERARDVRRKVNT